jgi:thioredoxin 1
VLNKYKPELTFKDGIKFKTLPLTQAMKIAKEEHKPLFVFLHATWCPTCKKMEQEVLNQKQPGETYNRGFVDVAIDYDSPERKQLNEVYLIRATPTSFFFNADGSIAKKLEGFTAKDELLATAKQLR